MSTFNTTAMITIGLAVVTAVLNYISYSANPDTTTDYLMYAVITAGLLFSFLTWRQISKGTQILSLSAVQFWLALLLFAVLAVAFFIYRDPAKYNSQIKTADFLVNPILVALVAALVAGWPFLRSYLKW